MQIIMKSLILAAVAALLPALFTQCASMGACSTEPLLSASGFRVVTPETEQQKAIYAELPAYKLQRGNHQGKVFYAYKNEKQGIAYLGGESEHQAYQRLAAERRIARDQYIAAEMNAATARGWYGAYPYGYRSTYPTPYLR